MARAFAATPYAQDVIMNMLRAVLLGIFLLAAALAAPGACLASGGEISAEALIENLKDAQGKVIVLNFWASWCQPCKMEIPELIDMRGDLSEDSLYMVGVSIDQNLEQYKSFAAKARFNYPVFHGGQDVAVLFGVSAIPRTMVFNKNGELAFSRDGYVSGEELRDILSKLTEG